MAASNLPTPEKLRVLLTDKTVPAAELDRIGDLFLDGDRPSVATMLYERSRTADRVKRILDRAIRDGDAFLMEWVARVAPEQATPAEWRRCAEQAARAGKTSFARTAWVKAGDPEKAAALKD